jgi:hypothetical protein
MKNILWILLGLIGLAILVFLSRDKQVLPHGRFDADSIKSVLNETGENPDAYIPYLNYEPKSYRRQPSEAFLGKKFHVIMDMIYEWPDAQLYEVNTEGLMYMRFKVNRKVHELHFIDDSCVADYITRK